MPPPPTPSHPSSSSSPPPPASRSTANFASAPGASAAASSAAASGIPKCSTGIEGVDRVLFGGLPRGRTTLLVGGPGTGKTVLALETLYRGALAGEPGLFVTFEEEPEAIRRNALALGWDLARLEAEGKLHIMHGRVPSDIVEMGEFDISGLLAVINGRIGEIGGRRIVIDAIDRLMAIFRGSHRREVQLLRLHEWLVAHGQTTLMTMKQSRRTMEGVDSLEFMVDCVLTLDQRVLGQVATRRLRVLKYRGSGFLTNEFPYLITERGVVLMPVASASAMPPAGPTARFSTGIDGLDTLLGGGIRSGTGTLIAGATGTGKSTLACSLATAACAAGARAIYVTFEEGAGSLIEAMRSPGIDLQSLVDRDVLRILAGLPESMGVEHHLWRLFEAMDSVQPRDLFIDTVSACARLGGEAVAFEFLLRILSFCRERGITCVCLNQTTPGDSLRDIGGSVLASLVDNLIILEQDWAGNDHRRQLLIVKMRGSSHSPNRHAWRITDQGIRIDRTESATADRAREHQ